MAQVPLLTCASDCQDTIVSAAMGHDCHVAGRHVERKDFHYHGCVGHSHGTPCDDSGEQAPDDETPGDAPGDGSHELIQVSVLAAGVRVALPAPEIRPLVLAPVDALSLLSQERTILEAAHQSDPDPVPVPPPASVRLLL